MKQSVTFRELNVNDWSIMSFVVGTVSLPGSPGASHSRVFITGIYKE